MQLIICKDYEEISKRAASEVAAAIAAKPDCVLGLPTGSTPVGMYKNLVSMNKTGEVDFSSVTTFNLDEYYPIEKDDSQSYYTFMYDNLFSHININTSNVHIPSGQSEDTEKFCFEYEEAIREAGGIDLQVLGAGVNGHIGFNEPDDALSLCTHKTALTKNTIEVNSRFFDDISKVPTHAVTMGIKTILDARKIIILISGESKAPVIDAMLSGKITTRCPATLLQLHKDVILITDVATMAKTEK
ncbi:MAG: glucosamine-6-phosphate deaminase [Clostridia bacterium]|nr:glucosamine-6-phosphate deaminase [Clostridia bacterium]